MPLIHSSIENKFRSSIMSMFFVVSKHFEKLELTRTIFFSSLYPSSSCMRLCNYHMKLHQITWHRITIETKIIEESEKEKQQNKEWKIFFGSTINYFLDTRILQDDMIFSLNGVSPFLKLKEHISNKMSTFFFHLDKYSSWKGVQIAKQMSVF